MQPLPTKGKYRILAEINMIPFIDIALVLLIIFMVMTPFLVQSQIKINLPKVPTVDTQLDRDHTLQVVVDRDGQVFVEGRAVPADGVENSLRGMLRDPASQPLVIQADKDVPFQRVVTVMDAAKKVGFSRLGVCVKQDAGRAAPKTRR